MNAAVASEAEAPHIVVVAPARFVLIPLAASVTGLTAKAIEKRIESGLWVKGIHYRRPPDGRIWIDLKGIQEWVEAETA